MNESACRSHYAKLENSPRLQRLLMFLSGGREATTMDIVKGANITAVNSAIHELRRNGVGVRCRQLREGDSRVFTYQLEEFAPPTLEWDGMTYA